MNAKLLSALTAFLLMGFVATAAYSDDKPAMDKMDMGQMHEMMHQCMSKHKDGKMCDHEMMDKCEKQMGKGECQKMMKEAKAQGKEEPKKK